MSRYYSVPYVFYFLLVDKLFLSFLPSRMHVNLHFLFFSSVSVFLFLLKVSPFFLLPSALFLVASSSVEHSPIGNVQDTLGSVDKVESVEKFIFMQSVAEVVRNK